MTEQMDHRAAIEHALGFTDPATAVQRTQAIVLMRMNGHSATADAMEEAVLISRCYLASVKAAWPGVVPKDAVPACDGVPEISYYFRLPSGGWAADGLDGGFDMNEGWAGRANKFERDYPGLKVDDKWLVKLMEGVK